MNNKKSRTDEDEDTENDANKSNAENNTNKIEFKKEIKEEQTVTNSNCNIVDEVGEVDDDRLQLTAADSDKLDTSNVDNEDSLNLTIGEDDAKIFQDEVS